MWTKTFMGCFFEQNHNSNPKYNKMRYKRALKWKLGKHFCHWHYLRRWNQQRPEKLDWRHNTQSGWDFPRQQRGRIRVGHGQPPRAHLRAGFPGFPPESNALSRKKNPAHPLFGNLQKCRTPESAGTRHCPCGWSTQYQKDNKKPLIKWRYCMRVFKKSSWSLILLKFPFLRRKLCKYPFPVGILPVRLTLLDLPWSP